MANNYEELVAELRKMQSVEYCVITSVENLPAIRIVQEAADAIEQLQKDLERSKEYEAFWEKEANEALRKFQVAIASKPRWIPVTERLPEEDCHVLAYYGFNRGDGHLRMMFMQVLDYYAHDPRLHFQHEGLYGMTVTHWMPLPEPPKVDQCADCIHYPPSSTDGKPCCACDPANPLTNCHEAKEETE